MRMIVSSHGLSRNRAYASTTGRLRCGPCTEAARARVLSVARSVWSACASAPLWNGNARRTVLGKRRSTAALQTLCDLGAELSRSDCNNEHRPKELDTLDSAAPRNHSGAFLRLTRMRNRGIVPPRWVHGPHAHEPVEFQRSQEAVFGSPGKIGVPGIGQPSSLHSRRRMPSVGAPARSPS